MARHEADREDLYKELASYAGRWELDVSWLDVPVVAGMRLLAPDRKREDGRLSVYLGPNRVYHFDCANRLRRAYVDGQLYRTQGATLSVMERERTEGSTTLRRHDLSESELDEFSSACRAQLEELLGTLDSGDFTILRAEEVESCQLVTLQDRLRSALANNLPLAPAIAGKR